MFVAHLVCRRAGRTVALDAVWWCRCLSHQNKAHCCLQHPEQNSPFHVTRRLIGARTSGCQGATQAGNNAAAVREHHCATDAPLRPRPMHLADQPLS